MILAQLRTNSKKRSTDNIKEARCALPFASGFFCNGLCLSASTTLFIYISRKTHTGCRRKIHLQ